MPVYAHAFLFDAPPGTEGAAYFLAVLEAAGAPLEMGLCLPDACDSAGVRNELEDGWEVLNTLLFRGNAPFNVSVEHVYSFDDRQRPGTAAACVAVLVAALLLAMCAATAAGAGGTSAATPQHASALPLLDSDGAPNSSADGLENGHSNGYRNSVSHTPPSAPHSAIMRMLGAWDVRTNFGKLVHVPPKATNGASETSALNGMRVVSMAWIVLGHTFAMAKAIAGYSNSLDIIDVLGHSDKDAASGWPMQLVIGAEIAVDTFFFLSAVLLVLLTLRTMDAKGRRSLSYVKMIVYRYIRLTPALAVAMLVYWQLLRFVPSGSGGPFFVRYQESISRRCDPTWWTELLYIQNFYPFNSDDVCMGWTWFLANDMVFFVIALPLIVLFARCKSAGWIASGVLAAASIGLTVWLVYQYHLSIYIFDTTYTRYSFYAYSKPYCRLPAYLVGVVCGAYLWKVERGDWRRPGRLSACAGLVLSVLAMAFILLCPVTDFSGVDSWGVVPSALYIAGARPVWALGCAVVTVACAFGHAPWVQQLLGQDVWVPLSRLTYSAYLCHPLVIKWLAGTTQTYYTWSYAMLLSRWCLNVVLTWCAALLLWLAAERPALTLLNSAIRR